LKTTIKKKQENHIKNWKNYYKNKKSGVVTMINLQRKLEQENYMVYVENEMNDYLTIESENGNEYRLKFNEDIVDLIPYDVVAEHIEDSTSSFYK